MTAEIRNRLRKSEWQRKAAIRRLNPEAKFKLQISKFPLP